MNTPLKLLILIAYFIYSESAEAQKSIKNDVTPVVATTPASSAAAPPSAAPQPACPAPLDVSTLHLYGLWQVSFHDGPLPPDGQADAARHVTARTTILFERHPEHADSLRGAMKPLADTHSPAPVGTVWLSGDLEDGELILDESDNGQRISAVWVAHPAVNGCGKVFKGNRRLADSDTLQTFTMTKTPGWR